MTYRLEMTIFRVPPSPNQISKSHWAKTAEVRALWRQLVRQSVANGNKAPAAPLKRARVTCTRFAPRKLDRDNLAMSFKPVLDGLVEAGVLQNDTPKVLVEQPYEQEYAPKFQSRIRVVVEELP